MVMCARQVRLPVLGARLPRAARARGDDIDINRYDRIDDYL